MLSLHAWANQPLAQSTEPSAEVHAEYIPGGLEAEYAQAAAQLLKFLKEKIYPAVPVSIRKQLSNKKINITLSKDPAADGVFIDDGGPDISIVMRYSELKTDNARQILTHEFFHAVHHALRAGEPAWVREGLAQLFEFTVLGYFNEQNVQAALADLSTPLKGSYVLGKTSRAQYGHDLLYFYYLWANCGRSPLLWKITTDGLETALEDASRRLKLEQCEGFDKSALHFELARAQNETDGAAARNEQIHYLWPTTLPTAKPRESISTQELGALEPYQPVVLNSTAALPVKLPQDMQVFWLQKSFPYSVLNSRPKTGKHVLLVLRLQPQDP